MGWRTSASGFWDVLEQLQCIAIKGTLLSSMLKIPRSMFRLFTCVLINKKKKKAAIKFSCGNPFGTARRETLALHNLMRPSVQGAEVPTNHQPTAGGAFHGTIHPT